MGFISIILLLLVMILLGNYLLNKWLSGPDLSQYDMEVPTVDFYRASPSPGFHDTIAAVKALDKPLNFFDIKGYISQLRENVDKLGDIPLISQIIPVSTLFDGHSIEGEWVIAENANLNHRLLYIHGGAFLFGSPKSHRAITDRLSRELGVAVFAVNYRKIPEHTRKQGISDCQHAYEWLLKNTPNQELGAEEIYISGDSAGGNLTLSLLGWLKSNKLRQADAAIVFSPTLDCTFSYDSIKRNAKTDIVLRTLLGKLHKLPQSIRSLAAFIMCRTHPTTPEMSPIFDNLSALPPTLIQASEVEMLVDDSRRYVNKAAAAGSPVKLQVWSNMCHVWQLFPLEESDESFEQVRLYIEEVRSAQSLI